MTILGAWPQSIASMTIFSPSARNRPLSSRSLRMCSARTALTVLLVREVTVLVLIALSLADRLLGGPAREERQADLAIAFLFDQGQLAPVDDAAAPLKFLGQQSRHR